MPGFILNHGRPIPMDPERDLDELADDISRTKMLEELPEATPTCERCGTREGGLCKDPGPNCPYGCELTGA